MVPTINPMLSCNKMSGFPVGAVGVIDDITMLTTSISQDIISITTVMALYQFYVLKTPYMDIYGMYNPIQISSYK